MIELLLIHKAEIDTLDLQGWTPLFWACFRGDILTVRCLLEGGADCFRIDENKWTSLHWAVSSGAQEVIEALLDHAMQRAKRAPAFHLPTSGWVFNRDISLFEVAAEQGDLSIFQILLEMVLNTA